MFSRTPKKTANKPALFLYGVQLSYFLHAKFLGMTFDHKFTFKKQKYHCIRMSVKSGDQAHKQFCESINNV